jgi:hypothetical protein
MVGKTEGMALWGDGSLALINDDDLGLTGARTQIVDRQGYRRRAPLAGCRALARNGKQPWRIYRLLAPWLVAPRGSGAATAVARTAASQLTLH